MTRLSLKYRIALTIFLLEAVMVALVLWQTQRVSLEGIGRQMDVTEHVMIDMLSDLSRFALINNEFGELQPYVEKIEEDPHVTCVLLADHRDTVVVSSVHDLIGSPLPPLPDQAGRYWRVQPLSNASGPVGLLAVEFSRAAIIGSYREARNLGVIIALVSMTVIALVGLLSGHLLTRRLDRLTAAAREIGDGHLSSRIDLAGDDETARLAGQFNLMADRIQQYLSELRKSEEQLRTMTDNVPGAVYRCDLHPPWAAERISEGVFQLTGYRAGEFLDGSVHRGGIVHEEDLAHVESTVREGVDRREPFVVEYRVFHRDGGVRFVHEKGRAVYDDDGSPLWLVGVIMDITAQRQVQEDKERLEKQIQHVQKLESLGVLAGGIAHDFNNLLMAILGNADLTLAHLSEVSPVRENVEAIALSSQRAADLCRQMLAYSGRGKFETKLIDLNELVREMNHMLDVSISKKASLKLNYAPALPPVLADPTQVRQVVMNLVINASEAIGNESGAISVTTGVTECDKAYLSGTFIDEELHPGLYVWLEIADTGCGMDEETRSRLFDPFFSTKFTGRGLGMSAVLGIMRGHRGAIKVYSEVGRGTNIKVLFPAAAGRREGEAGRAAAPRAESWRGTGTVLLVDDEETVRKVGTKMLRHLGLTVLIAENGSRALEIFRERPQGIDLVILDLTMPQMDGRQTFKEMRRIRPDARVVIASGYHEQEVTRKFLGEGIAGFIQKPYMLATLGEKLREVLGGG